MMSVLQVASNLPGYATIPTEFHMSDQWGNQLVDLWIKTRKRLTGGEISEARFKEHLADGIVGLSDWYEAFQAAAEHIGTTPTPELFQSYVGLHKKDAFSLIPRLLHAEFCWVPGWNGESVEDMMHELGLQSLRWKSCSFQDVVPGNWLRAFLQLINLPSAALIEALLKRGGEDGRQFVDRCHEAGFQVDADASRESVMNGEAAVSAIENAYVNAVTMFHCEINVRGLFEHDPSHPLVLTSAKGGKVHLGLHEVVNGAGYMDSYSGAVEIPVGASGFGGALSWPYGIGQTYGIVKPRFYAKPKTF